MLVPEPLPLGSAARPSPSPSPVAGGESGSDELQASVPPLPLPVIHSAASEGSSLTAETLEAARLLGLSSKALSSGASSSDAISDWPEASSGSASVISADGDSPASAVAAAEELALSEGLVASLSLEHIAA